MNLTWTQMIEELQSRRITLERIAEELNVSVRFVCHLKAQPQTMPAYDVGNRLVVLYVKHCSTNVQAMT